jgi:hypothetical protein
LPACYALTVAVASQVPPSDGPAVATTLAFGVDPATALGVAAVRGAQVFHKAEGFQTTTPPPLPVTPMVTFDPVAVFGPHFPTPPAVYPDVDAISLGTDIIPADCNGLISVPPGHWNFLVFSVRRGTLGRVGGAIRAEVGTVGGNEADFFHYIFHDSTCVPLEFVGETFKLADSLDYGMPVPAEVDAVDLAMQLYPLEVAIAPSLGLPACPFPCPTIYYSFEGSAANLALVPDAWGVPKSGATVYSSTWTGTAWGAPTVAFTPIQLGLMECEDLDALGVDAYDPGGLQLAYSTKVGGCGPVRDQLLFWQPGCLGDAVPAIPLNYGGGSLVSTDTGIVLRDDVDAICFGDPICQGNRTGQRGVVQLERTLAQPWIQSTTFGFPRQLAIQAIRDRTPSPNFGYLLVNVNGQPGGLGAFLLTVPPLYPFNFPAQILFAVPLTSPFPGAPFTQRITLPPTAFGAELILQSATLPRTPPFNVRISHALRLRVH